MKRVAVCLLAALSIASSLQASIELHPLFSDHAVLQRDKPIAIWGRSNSGETIVVSINGNTADTMSSPEGNWRVKLPPMKAGGPYELIVKGDSEVRVRDVYIGEVWLASGQSNMEFTVSKSVKRWAGTNNEEQEIAQANHPQIRMLTVPLKLTDDPKDTIEATWQVCSPDTVPAFSAIGYFFAREISQTQNVPVGIISSAFGASCAQAWMSREALEPQFQPMLDAYQQWCDDYASGAAQTKYEASLKEWELASAKAKEEGKAAPRKPGVPRNPREDQHNPTLCYNAMIAPLIPYTMRGAIWYQGESNGYNNQEYLSLMTGLIQDWRRRWDAEFPFLFVQLAAYKTPATQPVANSQIAAVRDAQRLTLALPHTAMASTLDIGDEKDVHPHNKQEVGRRLALAARAIAYGESIDYTGPLFKRATIEGKTIRVEFDHAKGLAIRPPSPGGNATTQPSHLAGFSILSDGQWQWADARIEGDSVLIAIPKGAPPTELRYAWADYPICNLINATGLPASPFRVEFKEEGRK